MFKLPSQLKNKLIERESQNILRSLGNQKKLIDFASNDYLGFSKSPLIFDTAYQTLSNSAQKTNGSTGSRLLSGNHPLYTDVETMLCEVHHSESALIFNSGYDANLGFFSSVPQRGDLILYDELCHASIRDGIGMGLAKAHKFKHNDFGHLLEIIKRVDNAENIYVVTESIFSMDGDAPDLIALVRICKTHRAYLVVDEAHAVGIFGKNGVGLIQHLGLQNDVFARTVTFGKALGCHGAAILGSSELKDYLINFSRPFIYSTALPPHALASIRAAYEELDTTSAKPQLLQNIETFKASIKKKGLQSYFIESNSAIQSCIIPGNEIVKSVSKQLENNGFDVKPILSPTVPQGKERLRFCIHTYNSPFEISEVISLLATFVK